MTRREPVVSIYWPSASGIWGGDGSKLICCVDGWEPKIHKVWSFGYDGITSEFHPTVIVDVRAGIVGQISPNYLTENRTRVLVYTQISINGSVEYLGIPNFHRTGRPFWGNNILDPCSNWGGTTRGEGCTTTNLNWGSQPDVSVLWRHAVLACPTYLLRILVNPCAAAHRVRGDHL